MLPPLPIDPEAEAGLALSLVPIPKVLVGVVAWVVEGVTTEFFLVPGPLLDWVPIFLDARVDAAPDATGIDAPEPRFLFFITSVFKESGRTTPWSFKNSPQALQRGWPSGFRRHRGVV